MNETHSDICCWKGIWSLDQEKSQNLGGEKAAEVSGRTGPAGGVLTLFTLR